jgi:hypothetical protein
MESFCKHKDEPLVFIKTGSLLTNCTTLHYGFSCLHIDVDEDYVAVTVTVCLKTCNSAWIFWKMALNGESEKYW